MTNTEEAAFSVFRKMTDGPAVAVHGQVFTKPHIVDFMLDLAGYTPDKPLHSMSLLEPGCGNGAFLVPAAKRLLASKPDNLPPEALARCLSGVEKDDELAQQTRDTLAAVLSEKGVRAPTAKKLAEAWVTCADFFEMTTELRFEFIAGNPPYVRQEAIPKNLIDAYRERFSCFYDRADLYVAFFERSLELLAKAGTLAFICPNRFTRNNYGRKLRAHLTGNFKLTHVVDLPEATPFEPEVLAYPGIYVVQHGKTATVEHVLMKEATVEECKQAQAALAKREIGVQGSVAYHPYESWFSGEAKWATHTPQHLTLLRKLEEAGVPLGGDGSGCKVGIGVATGADDVYIVKKGQVDVEDELLLPLVTTKDIVSGDVLWTGKYLINPFEPDDSGRLIRLDKYPKAQRYFTHHKQRLANRNVGKRNPESWYRTIDRVHRRLTDLPMILIPDIKVNNQTIALKEGPYYPHHNLYFVTSEYWPLSVLKTILRSDVARFFVFMYGVRMRQGYYRFQAQYLRRICVPPRMLVDEEMVSELATASRSGDAEKQNSLVAKLYGLTWRDVALLKSFDEATNAGGAEEPREE